MFKVNRCAATFTFVICLSLTAVSLFAAAKAVPGASPDGKNSDHQNDQSDEQGEKQNGQAGQQGQSQNGQSGQQGENQNGQSGQQGDQQSGQSGDQGDGATRKSK